MGAVQSDNNKNSVFVVALASDAADTVKLMRLGKDGFVNAADLSMLGTAFDTIAEKIGALTSSVYRLQYCTPKRSGSHTVQVTIQFTDMSMQSYLGSVKSSFAATDSFTCQIQ